MVAQMLYGCEVCGAACLVLAEVRAKGAKLLLCHRCTAGRPVLRFVRGEH